MRFLFAFAVSLLALWMPASARNLIAVLPEDYSQSSQEILKGLAVVAINLSPGDKLIVLRVDGPSQVAMIAVPDDPRAANPAWRNRHLGADFQPVVKVLAELPAIPTGAGAPENLRIPETLAEIGRNIVPTLPDRNAEVLLIGSLRFFDPRETGSAMIDRYYPSDGFLGLSPSVSPYGLVGAENRLSGVTVHFCSPGASEFETHEYQIDVERFWSLFVTGQSGRVGTYSHDLNTCFSRFAAGEASGQAVYQQKAGAKAEMLRARSPVSALPPSPSSQPGEYLLRDDTPISHAPPASAIGVAWIGLKWDAPCDIDLWTRGDGTKPWLFFGNVRSDEGFFNHDYQAATGKQQSEFVEYTKPIDIRQTEVAINLFAADLPAGRSSGGGSRPVQWQGLRGAFQARRKHREPWRPADDWPQLDYSRPQEGCRTGREIAPGFRGHAADEAA